MPNFKIITDSACDLPAAMLQQMDVITTPLYVLFKGQDMPDTVEDGAIADFYAGMRAGEVAKTAAANPEGWTAVIEPVLAAGQDALVLGFSSGLSTTYQSAVIAAEELMEKYPDRKVVAVDTLCAALGQGLLVWHACRMRDAGLSLEELAAWVEKNRLRLAHWFTVDDLVYLKRGGRVSAATAVMGAMLNIKPVLKVDNDGKLVSALKVRGRKSAVKALADKLAEADGTENSMIFICHADAAQDAELLKTMVEGICPGAEVMIGNLGAVIGSHAGPGTLALFFMDKQR